MSNDKLTGDITEPRTVIWPATGMSLRDYFANGALIGIRAHPAHERPQGVAQWCYQVADAMLAAREEKS